MKEKSVIVIGAGIIGLCSAYYLNKKGFKVTVIDNTDGFDNCSYGNAGFFSPSHLIPLASPGIISQGLRWMLKTDSPFYVKPKLSLDLLSWGLKFRKAATDKKVKLAAPLLNNLLLESKTLIENILQEEAIDAGFNNQGLMIYCKTQRAFDEEIEVAEFARANGQEVDVLSPEEAKRINPNVDIDVIGAVHFKNDACFTPHVFMEKLKSILQARGVELLFNKTITRLVPSNSGSIKEVVVNNDESLAADSYVIAAGTWSKELLKQLAIKLPMQAGKGYSFVIPTPTNNLKTCAILNEARVAVTPMTHGLRFAGTMEINGLDASINKRRVQGIVDSVSDFFPQFTKEDFDQIEPWTGFRPCSPDGLPYVGRTRKYKNLMVATGHAMLGVSLGPVTGKIIAQLASEELPELDISLLNVDRYN